MHSSDRLRWLLFRLAVIAVINRGINDYLPVETIVLLLQAKDPTARFVAKEFPTCGHVADVDWRCVVRIHKGAHWRVWGIFAYFGARFILILGRALVSRIGIDKLLREEPKVTDRIFNGLEQPRCYCKLRFCAGWIQLWQSGGKLTIWEWMSEWTAAAAAVTPGRSDWIYTTSQVRHSGLAHSEGHTCIKHQSQDGVCEPQLSSASGMLYKTRPSTSGPPGCFHKLRMSPRLHHSRGFVESCAPVDQCADGQKVNFIIHEFMRGAPTLTETNTWVRWTEGCLPSSFI